jgi:hypothetical protein
MPTTIKLKNSVTTTNVPSSLAQGEVAINVTDKKVWVGNAATTPVQLLGTGSDGSFTNLTVSGTTALNGGATLGDASGDALTINSSAVSIPNGLNFDSGTFVIDATNNRVGVGTASPSVTFDVSSATGSASPTPTEVRIATTTSASDWSTTSPWGRLSFYSADASDSGAKIQGSVDFVADLTSGGRGSMVFNTAAPTTGTLTERIRIGGTGAVGIGTNSPSSFNSSGLPLVVGTGTGVNGITIFSGNASAGSIHFADAQTAGADSYRGIVGYDHSTNYMFFYTDASERMRITSAGNVGIGTTNITAPLTLQNSTGVGVDIVGQTNDVANLRFRNQANNANVAYCYADNSQMEFGSAISIPLRFVTGGTEKMRLDSSGNLGLGVTPPSGSSTAGIFMSGVTNIFGSTTNGITFAANAYRDAGVFKYVSTSTATRYSQEAGAHSWLNAPSGTAGNAITFTQAMTLNASGNLGIGTTSPTRRLHVHTSGTNTDIALTDATLGTTYGGILRGYGVGGSGGYVELGVMDNATDYSKGIMISQYATSVRFFTGTTVANNTERMRIDSSGGVFIGKTSSDLGTAGVQFLQSGESYFTRSAGASLFVNRLTNDGSLVEFYGQGVNRGGISVSGSTISYNSYSDYRLKENILPMTGALAKVSQLKPVTYTWKENGLDGQGFIAHELAEVVPDCVTGEKDAVDEDGNPKYQGIDTSFLVATLTAAIQELKAIVDAQAARIAVLESK